MHDGGTYRTAETYAKTERIGYAARRPVVFVLLATSLLLGLLGTPVQVQANPFVDVPAGHWAYNALEQLSAVGLIDGYSPGFFSGSRKLTRYEVALSLAEGLRRLTSADAEGASLPAEAHLADLVLRYNEKAGDEVVGQDEADHFRSLIAEFDTELHMLGHTTPTIEPWATAVATAGTPPERLQLDGSVVPLARQMFLTGLGRVGDDDRTSVSPSSQIPILSWRTATEQGEAPTEPFGIALGRIGSTVLYVDGDASRLLHSHGGPVVRPALDGAIHSSDDALREPLFAGAEGDDNPLPPWHVTETRVGVQRPVLAPFLSMSGERSERSNVLGEVAASAVSAKLQLGDVALDGTVRRVESGSEPFAGVSASDTFGLGLSVRFGDVLLSTGRDVVQRTDDSDVEHVTSLSLEYGLPEQPQVRAGWQSVTLEQLRDARSRTSVDVNVPVPQGALHLGLAYLGAREGESAGISMTTLTTAGFDVDLLENTRASAAFSMEDSAAESRRTTSLGLRYTLSAESALLLGYKLIDFADDADADRQNVTTAEFSIRF